MGELVIALDRDRAPKTVNNFVFLAAPPLLRRDHLPPHHRRLRVPGRRSHRHRPRRPGYRFEDELPKPGQYEIGSVAMANAGPEHQRQPVLPDLRSERRRASAALQPVRQDREGPRRARRDAAGADRQQRSPEHRRRHQLGHDHRRRLTHGAPRRLDHLAVRGRGASHRARRAGIRRPSPRQDASTAATCVACSTESG